MASSAIHFSIGMAVTGLAILPRLVRTWKQRGDKMAARLRSWLLLSYAVGLFAVVPNILRRAGMDEAICASAWMNVFLLHPLVDRVVSSGRSLGPVMVALIFAAQYGVLLAAAARASRMRAGHSDLPLPPGEGRGEGH